MLIFKSIEIVVQCCRWAQTRFKMEISIRPFKKKYLTFLGHSKLSKVDQSRSFYIPRKIFLHGTFRFREANCRRHLSWLKHFRLFREKLFYYYTRINGSCRHLSFLTFWSTKLSELIELTTETNPVFGISNNVRRKIVESSSRTIPETHFRSKRRSGFGELFRR